MLLSKGLVDEETVSVELDPEEQGLSPVCSCFKPH